MNNNNDYLWDRTGEPDPEIQQLEEILGTLRYQPRPLEIPEGLKVGRERSFFRGFAVPLAIAAAIATLLLGLGLWLGLQRLQRSEPRQIVKNSASPAVVNPNPVETPADKKQNLTVAVSPPMSEKTHIDESSRHAGNPARLPGNSSRIRNAMLRDQLNARQKQEAEVAKNQLMLALRLTSAKLSLAQKKAQSTNPYNQHKIG